MTQSILIYLLTINLFTILLFFIDKRKASKGQYRISEKTLLTCCAIGGSIGGFVAMQLFRHKTQKRSFLLPFYLIVVIQIMLVYFYCKQQNLI